MATFKRPLTTARQRVQFSPREPGLNHPDTEAYIKLCDNGNGEFMADEGLGIIIDRSTRSIHLFADNVVIHSRTMRWNSLSFNQRATKYIEPAFTDFKLDNVTGLFETTQET